MAMVTDHIDSAAHPIDDPEYVAECRDRLRASGALVLQNFARSQSIREIVALAAPREVDAYYAGQTHNVYLTPSDPNRPDTHVFNRQILSSKGLIADDQISADSPLRDIYNDRIFRRFLCGVLEVEAVYPYADNLSSINVHYAAEGMELGWHFDNSSFAVTMLLQAAEGGAAFEYVPAVRDSASGDMAFDRVEQILDGEQDVQRLHFKPGDLVLFRGRDAMHRVTPTEGDTTRLLVVFAYNDEPGIALSESALGTFYGRGSTPVSTEQ